MFHDEMTKPYFSLNMYVLDSQIDIKFINLNVEI